MSTRLRTISLLVFVMISLFLSLLSAQSSSAKGSSLKISSERSDMAIDDKQKTRKISYSNEGTIGTDFKTCTNVSSCFMDSDEFLDGVIRNAPIGGLKCKNVNMWKSFSVPASYSASLFVTYEQYTLTVKDSYDLCETIQSWEEKLQTNCVDLLFNSTVNDLSSRVQFITQNQTTVYEWINYCRYCKKNVQFSKLDYSNIRDENVREMIEYFPDQISYCGFSRAGIPFVVEEKQIIRAKSDIGYSYICYCPYNNFYAFKCFDNSRNMTYALFLQVLLILIFSISFIITFFSTFLPRLKMIFIQKQYYNILVPLSVCLSQICGLMTQALFGAGIDIALSISSNLTIFFVSIALVCWEMNWVRLIYYIIRKKRLSSWVSYLFPLTWFFVAVGAMLACIFTEGTTYNLRMGRNLSFLQLTLGCLVTLAFIICSIVIYILLKKVSEVSLLNSPFLKFSISASIALFLDSVGIIAISMTDSYITSIGITFTLVHAMLLGGISLGLTWVEFDKKEFLEFYSCLKAIKSFDTTDQKTEPLLSTSDYSSIEDASSIQNSKTSN